MLRATAIDDVKKMKNSKKPHKKERKKEKKKEGRKERRKKEKKEERKEGRKERIAEFVRISLKASSFIFLASSIKIVFPSLSLSQFHQHFIISFCADILLPKN